MLFFFSKPLLVIALAVIVVVLICCASALWKSRIGNSSVHRLAFYSGIAGLLAIPTALLGLIGVFMQPLTAKMLSIEGLALLGGTLGGVIACITSYSAVLVLHGGNSKVSE